MLLLLAAEAGKKAPVWTYWISWFLAVPAVLIVIGIVVGYLVLVESKKYPRR